MNNRGMFGLSVLSLIAVSVGMVALANQPKPVAAPPPVTTDEPGERFVLKCFMRDRLVETLRSNGAQPVMVGLETNNSAMEIWRGVGSDDPLWVAVVIIPTGRACIVGGGPSMSLTFSEPRPPTVDQ